MSSSSDRTGTSTLKVAHVVPGLDARGGGVAANVVDAALGLQENGVRNVVVTTDIAGTASRPHRHPVRVEDMPAGAADLELRLCPLNHPYRIVFSRGMWRTLEEEFRLADVVHIHSLFLYPQFAAFRQAERQKVPFVVSPQGGLDPYLRDRGRVRKRIADKVWQSKMFERAGAVHLVSNEEAQLASDVLPAVRTVVIPQAIDWSSLGKLPSPTVFREKYLAGYQGLVVLYLGRLTEKKGVDVLVRAFHEAVCEGVEARLVLAGPEDEGMTNKLAALAASLRIDHLVSFAGMLQGEDKRGALAAADVWALSSHSEGSAVAVIEALAAGCAVVVSPAVNVTDARSSGAALLAPALAKPFGQAIRRLLQDEVLRRALGTRARLFAQQYDRKGVAGSLNRLYVEVIDAHHPRGEGES